MNRCCRFALATNEQMFNLSRESSSNRLRFLTLLAIIFASFSCSSSVPCVSSKPFHACSKATRSSTRAFSLYKPCARVKTARARLIASGDACSESGADGSGTLISKCANRSYSARGRSYSSGSWASSSSKSIQLEDGAGALYVSVRHRVNSNSFSSISM
ncbi:hypothetical protein KC357_g94 [Hortaea werneckii]|nr:hypothetical protein KC357_g94 [Hortaea werneckii]